MPASLQEIRETFTVNQNALPLVPKIISRTLLEYVRKYKPLGGRILPRQTWMTDRYIFNQRTGIPTAQMTTEAPASTGTGSVAATSSAYNQVTYYIKHMQAALDISTFSAQVATVNGNVYDLELAGAAMAMAYLEEIQHLFGSAGATLNSIRPGWDGLDLLCASANKIDAASAAFSGQQIAIKHLDAVIDQVKSLVAMELSDNYALVVSPKMLSAINQLFVQYARYTKEMRVFSRDDYGIPGGAVVDNAFDGGIEVLSYRGIPIVESSFLASVGTMGTIAVAAGTGTGTFPGSQAYYYVVEAVTNYGITVASNEVNATPTTAQVNTVSWSAPTFNDAFGNPIPILNYRIHRGTAAGAESLYAVVSAKDNTDTAITSFVDTNNPVNPSTNASAYATTVAVSGSNATSDGATFPRVQTTGQNVEDIFLVPRDPDFCVVPVVNEMQTVMLAPINARSRQFALTEDAVLAVRAPSFIGKISRVRSS